MSETDAEDIGFDIELHEAPEVGDDADYHLLNKPGGENQRKHILQEGKPKDLTLHGDLYAVVHGTLTPNGDDATLIVMQFTFAGSTSCERRFRKVEIKIKFANGEDAFGTASDPVVKTIAPEGEFVVGEQSTETSSTKLTAGISVPVAQGTGVELKAGLHHSTTTVRSSRATIFGTKRIEMRRYGSPNMALWKLTEDKIGKTGVPSSLRAAILVVPQTEDGFRAIVEVDATADAMFAAEVKSRRWLGKSQIHPVYFNCERENLGPQLDGVDPDNLSACKVAEIAFVKVRESQPPTLPTTWQQQLRISGPRYIDWHRNLMHEPEGRNSVDMLVS